MADKANLETKVFKDLTLPEILALATLGAQHRAIINPEFTAGRLVGLGVAHKVSKTDSGYNLDITHQGRDWLAQASGNKEIMPCPEDDYPCKTCGNGIKQGNDCWHITGDSPLVGLHHITCLEKE